MIRYLHQLPHDILDIIFNYLNKNKINNIKIKYLLYNNNFNNKNIKIIFINRANYFIL